MKSEIAVAALNIIVTGAAVDGIIPLIPTQGIVAGIAKATLPPNPSSTISPNHKLTLHSLTASSMS